MNDNKKQFSINTRNGNSTHLLRIGVIFLSIVSFFTTANGMREYIFVDNDAVAYAASAAIQGILLALSMNLPDYLRNIYHSENDKTVRKIIQQEKQSWLEQSKQENSGKTQKQKKFDFSAKATVLLPYLPGILIRFIFKTFLCTCAILLTIVTIFCSSWFSYIYIADIIHQDSWETDSELLVQQTYRTELYNARDYAHNYRIYLEESIGDKILLLDEQTQNLSDSTVDLTVNWSDERYTYVVNSGTAASSYMSTVINAMERALPQDSPESSSQEARELAATAITDAKKNITERMEDIQRNLDTLNTNITNYNNQITNLRNQINRATESTDMTSLSNSINSYTQLINSTSQRQADLQTEYLQLDSALLRLPYYEVQLGLSSSTSSMSIKRDLLQLQTEFFQPEPDQDELLHIATTIFENLRNAARQTADGEALEDDLSYTNLLVQMNQLIRNLTDYTAIKNIESELDQLIDELRHNNQANKQEMSSESEDNLEANVIDTTMELDSPEDIASSAEASVPSEPVESMEPSETESPTESESPSRSSIPVVPDSSTKPSNMAEPGSLTEPSTPPSSEPSDSKPEDTVENGWQQVWGEKIDELKSRISAMPVYSAAEKTENGKINVLSESQINVLTNYDRDNSSRTLDDITRRYISNHNAVYQGIIYLQSPYRSLALFALLLALSFDLSGFIFGFVAQGYPQQNENKESPVADGNVQPEQCTLYTGENDQTARHSPDTNSNIQTTPDIPDIGMNGRTIPRMDINIDNRASNHSFTKRKHKTQNASLTDDSVQAAWSILKTLTLYIVLTGDYECRDGIYYYKTFKDGLLHHWAVKDTTPYAQGIYIQEKTDEEWTKGLALPKDGQALRFTRQADGPKDGIYMNCQLIYDEGSLILVKENQQSFLASVDEYVPVHSYNPSHGENRTIPSKKLAAKKNDDQVVVIALNTKGTRIAAIYIIEHI